MATNKDFIVKSGLQVQSTASSTSTSSGALIVAGGAGIAGDLYVGGNIYLTDGVGLDNVYGSTATFKNLFVTGTNVSSSTTSGAVQITGGLGVQGNIYGTAIYDNNARVVTTATIGSFGVTTLTAGTDTAISTSTGNVVIWNTGTLQSITNRGSTTTNAININNATPSTTTGSGALIVSGGVGISQQLTANNIKVTDTTDSGVNAGSLQVAGGVYIAKSTYIASTASSTATATSNALYVDGGAYINNQLTVNGTTLFKNAVTFSGTATYVYSTNTFYTDNILEVHTPPGGVGALWNLDDGKDIGLRFHYYANSTDTNAALVLANDTKMLEWYNTGAESTTGTFTGAGYGTFKTGAIILTSSTAAISTGSGALQVQGGVGVGGSLYASALYDNNARVLTTSTIGSFGVTTLTAGTDTAVSTSTGNVVIWNTSTLQTITNRGSTTTNAININNSTASTATNTGALIVGGGVGIGGAAYVGGILNVVNSASIATSGVGDDLFIGQANSRLIINAGLPNNSIRAENSTGTVGIYGGGQTTTGLTVSAVGIVTINATTASTTSTNGALVVLGGVGIGGDVYAKSIYDNGNRVVSSVTANAGVGISISGATTAGPNASFTVNNTGVTTATGSTYIGVSTSSGNVVITNLGVTNLTGTAGQISVSTSTGSVTLSLAGSISVSTGTFTNLAVTGTDASFSASTGALQVTNGGVGIGKSIYVGTTATVAGTFNRTGNVSALGWGTAGVGFVLSTATFTDTSLSGAQTFAAVYSIGRPTIAASNSPTYSDVATLYIDNSPAAGTNTVITNPWSLYVNNGNVKIAATSVSNATTNGALVVGGGVGIGGALNVGGAGSFAATGVTVGNTLISSYTSSAISTTSTQNLDTFSTSTYRSAKYTVQIVDATKVHVTEMMVFHDNTTVYKMEYGISTNTGELGTFDATLAANVITLTFTPNYTPTSMIIKANRTSITA